MKASTDYVEHFLRYIKQNDETKIIAYLGSDSGHQKEIQWLAFSDDPDYQNVIYRMLEHQDPKRAINVSDALLLRYKGFADSVNLSHSEKDRIYPLSVLIALGALKNNPFDTHISIAALKQMAEHGVRFNYLTALSNNLLEYIYSIPNIKKPEINDIAFNFLSHHYTMYQLLRADADIAHDLNSNGVDLSSWNHEIMADKYFELIADNIGAQKFGEKSDVKFFDMKSLFNSSAHGHTLLIPTLAPKTINKLMRADPSRPRDSNSILEEIKDTHILQDSLGKKLASFMARHKFDQARERRMGYAPKRRNHLLFAGAPGTGKTTIAQHMGDFFKSINLLEKGHLVDKRSTQLIARFVGHTAPLMTAAFDEARGGILFIDEAYHFATDKFGPDAVTELLALMENHHHDTIVILAGYKKELDELMDINPGLASRFADTIMFDDFTKSELGKILNMNLEEHSLYMNDAVRSEFISHIWALKEKENGKYANARTLEVELEKVINAHALRWEAEGSDCEGDDFLTLTISDVLAGIKDQAYQASSRQPIGFHVPAPEKPARTANQEAQIQPTPHPQSLEMH